MKTENLLASVDWQTIGNKVWAALTSRTALFVYALCLLVLVMALVVRMIVNEYRRVAELKDGGSGNAESARREALDTAKHAIDKKLDAIQENLAFSVNPYSVPASKMAAVAEKKKTGEEGENGSRFYMLTEIDKKYEKYVAPEYDEGITLREVCEEFRAFSAEKLKLYYDIGDIRRFIGGMAVTKLLILQGMSGTGKTSLAYAFGEFLENTTVVVPIQPMWKERTDLVGYYNEFTRRFN